MKKFFLAAILATMTLASQAQIQWFSAERPAQRVTKGAYIGVDVSNQSLETSISLLDSRYGAVSPKAKAGFVLGAALDVAIIKSISIKGALEFSTKACSTSNEYTLDLSSSSAERHWVKMDMTSSWLSLPIVANYHFFINKDMQVQLGLGEYIALGLGGSLKHNYGNEFYDSKNYALNKLSETSNSYSYFSEGRFSRFDYGLVLSAAFQWNNLIGNIQYRHGFQNLVNNTSVNGDGIRFSPVLNANSKMRTWYFTVGWMF